MRIKIGGNIRKLRAQNGMTQERLAEYLGVSPQAISRWESETCYPDLEMLPGIASFFGVSIDELLGYDSSEQEQMKILQKITALIQSGKQDEAREEARYGLGLYPKNHAIATALASLLFTSHKDDSELEECIALCRRVLRDCTSDSEAGDLLRIAAKNMLVLSLIKTGDRKGALEVAQTLPVLPHVRDFNIQMALEGEERWNFSVSALPLMCVMLGVFLNKMSHLGEKGIPICFYTLEECRRDLQVWDALYYEADKRDGGVTKRSNFVYMYLHFTAARKCAQQGEKAEALKHLAEASRCAGTDEPSALLAANTASMETIAQVDPACTKREDNYKGKNFAFFIYYGYIQNGCFEALKDEPEYADIEAAIKKAAEA